MPNAALSMLIKPTPWFRASSMAMWLFGRPSNHCCGILKRDALKATLQGTGQRMRLNLDTGKYEPDADRQPYTGVIVGARADEEGSRSKERYFSPRDKNNAWDVGDQPPEFWNQFKTDFAPGTHLRIHPLLDWTELNIWEYIKRESIPTVSLYNAGTTEATLSTNITITGTVSLSVTASITVEASVIVVTAFAKNESR